MKNKNYFILLVLFLSALQIKAQYSFDNVLYGAAYYHEYMPYERLDEDKPHSGEEFGYLISGRVKLHLGEKVYQVKAGNSFYYPAKEKHWIENPGSRPAKFIWGSTPPNF